MQSQVTQVNLQLVGFAIPGGEAYAANCKTHSYRWSLILQHRNSGNFDMRGGGRKASRGGTLLHCFIHHKLERRYFSPRVPLRNNFSLHHQDYRR